MNKVAMPAKAKIVETASLITLRFLCIEILGFRIILYKLLDLPIKGTKSR